MVFLVAGIAAGVIGGGLRAHLRSKWLWLGAALAILIFLPNLVWQWRHDLFRCNFSSTSSARCAHRPDKDFLPDQLTLTFSRCRWRYLDCFLFLELRWTRFRVLGWMFVVPFALFVLGKGRGYYMAAGYPVLYAGGAVLLASWLTHLARPWRMLTGAIGWTAMAANIILFGSLFLPIAPVNSPWWHRMTATNDDVKEEIGWQELVETVARIRDALPPERSRTSTHFGWQLRRSRRDQFVWAGFGIAAGDLPCEFFLEARIRRPASGVAYRTRVLHVRIWKTNSNRAS